MQIFEIFELEKFPFMGTMEIIQEQIIADVLNEDNFDKVYLLVDHDTKRIWKYNGPNSSLKLQNYGDILAGMLRKQLRLFYKIYSLNTYLRDDPEFQQILQKPIRGDRARPIEKRDFPEQENERSNGVGDLPFPYIFKPPSPPGDLGLMAEPQAKRLTNEKDTKNELYCKYCGAELPKGQSICHVCGNKVI